MNDNSSPPLDVDRTPHTRAAPAVDWEAALAAPPIRVPRRAIKLGIVAVVVLGGGGVLAENVFTSTGLNAYSVTATSGSVTAHSTRVVTSALPKKVENLLGLEQLSGARAPSFSLTDQHGAQVSLASLSAKIVVLSFFDAVCDDICPVESREINQAEADLGTLASKVDFVVVNSDPRATSVVDIAETSAATGLGAHSNFYFLTATLGTLDIAWTRYNVAVDVADATHVVSHTDVVYFLGPHAKLRYSATPFADESRSGRYSLSTSTTTSFGADMADVVRQLLH